MIQFLVTAIILSYVCDAARLNNATGGGYGYLNSVLKKRQDQAGCSGGDSCCINGICNWGEGDCDKDGDCAAGLVCGKDNCRSMNGDRPSFDSTDDCCECPGSAYCCGGDSCCRNGVCNWGEGDCDSNKDCAGELVCGKDNCRTMKGDRPSFDSTDDCCECQGGDNCCTNGICSWGQGDCDSDKDCAGELVCGKDNCRSMKGDRPLFDSSDDCCECQGGDNCCTNGICSWGQGDCDSDKDCADGLKCGTDNCRTMAGGRPSFDSTDDCCY